MKETQRKRIVALALAIVMMASGVIESKAATNNVIYLLGIHEFEGGADKGHSQMCSWLKSSGTNYRKCDSTATITKRHYTKNTTVLNIMRKYNYLMIMTHGWDTGITVYDDSGNGSYLSVDRIKNDGDYVYGQLKVCHIMACKSAEMAKAVYQKGAKITIGYRELVIRQAGSYMMKLFNKYFSSGQSVLTSMGNAKAWVVSNYGTDKGVEKYVIFGDGQRTYN